MARDLSGRRKTTQATKMAAGPRRYTKGTAGLKNRSNKGGATRGLARATQVQEANGKTSPGLQKVLSSRATPPVKKPAKIAPRRTRTGY